MPDLKCGAPPRKFWRGDTEYTETCNRPSFTWTASKGGHSEQLVRCNEHAAQLRAKGFDVRITQAPAALAGKRKWDLTSTNSLEAAAGYLRKNSGAVLVLVVRAGDAVVVVDDGVEPGDVAGVIERCLHEAVDRLAGIDEQGKRNTEEQHV